MTSQELELINELKEMIGDLIQENRKLLECVKEIREEQKKISEEIRIQNLYLNVFPIKNEIIN